MDACALTNHRVLVVEDQSLIALDLEMALNDAQATVLGPISRVQAGLDLVAREAQISAAILDVNVGSEMVFPVADALLERSVPFLFATGEHPARSRGALRVSRPTKSPPMPLALSDKLRACCRIRVPR